MADDIPDEWIQAITGQPSRAAIIRAVYPLVAARVRADTANQFRRLAGQLSVGWEDEPDPSPTYVAYGQAFKEAARRINEVADQFGGSS